MTAEITEKEALDYLRTKTAFETKITDKVMEYSQFRLDHYDVELDDPNAKPNLFSELYNRYIWQFFGKGRNSEDWVLDFELDDEVDSLETCIISLFVMGEDWSAGDVSRFAMEVPWEAICDSEKWKEDFLARRKKEKAEKEEEKIRKEEQAKKKKEDSEYKLYQKLREKYEKKEN